MRYQEIPDVTYAPRPDVAAVWEKGLAGGLGPSMAQSCGTFTVRQPVSAKVAPSAPVASP